MAVCAERTVRAASIHSEEGPTPITAKLSRRFYEQFGDAVVDELVNLLNAVDSNSRSELREINELNFARFDAKVEQRFAESDARMERRFAERDVYIERRFAETDAKIDRRVAELRGEIVTLGAGLRVEMHDLKADLMKWMFLFVTGGTLANILFK